MRLLIVKTAAMGDVVHALPVVSDIVRLRTGVSVDWLVQSALVPLVRLHPGVRKVHGLDATPWHQALFNPKARAAAQVLRADLLRERYDLVLDLEGRTHSALWGGRAKAPVAGFSAQSAQQSLAAWLYDLRAQVPRAVHEVHRNRQLAAAHLKYALPRERADFGLRAPVGGWIPKGQAYAVLIPHASQSKRLWPERHWVAVGRHLAERRLRPLVLWRSETEQVLAERIAAECDGDVPPQLDLPGVATVLDRARCVVGLDTGHVHLAAALGRPTLAVHCDHDPGLAGPTGGPQVFSVGGKGQVPGRAEVQTWVERLLES